MLKKQKKRKNDELEMIFNTKSEKKFEDLLEKPLGKYSYFTYIFIFLFFIFLFLYRFYQFQIVDGEKYLKQAKNNLIKTEYIFANRGVVFDRNGEKMIWNSLKDKNNGKNNNKDKEKNNIPDRVYLRNIGLSHILGFISYPKKDKNGHYLKLNFEGKAGVEKYFNDYLNGKNGEKKIEINSRGKEISKNTFSQPVAGKNLKLTIDLTLQKELKNSLEEYIKNDGFKGAAGVIMKAKTGEILASVSIPEYDPNILVSSSNKSQIKKWLVDKTNPFLNRVFLGGYTPGSTVKPFVALMGLENNIMTPNWKIKTNGKLILPNKWNPKKPTIFVDWKNHGTVDMYKAIAWSSNIYFYIIGGGLHGILGYQDREGLGIERLLKGFKEFGFGKLTQVEKFKEKKGFLPSPEWKKEKMKTKWTIADTYFTSIGQFSFIVTPLQMAVATSILVNNGKKIQPIISELGKKGKVLERLNFKKENLEAVKRAMRMTVTQGTGRALNFDFVKIAGKSGTAQIKGNTRVNSWFIGFWPYENPKYVFVVMADDGPKHYKHSVAWGVSSFFRKLHKENLDEKYFK